MKDNLQIDNFIKLQKVDNINCTLFQFNWGAWHLPVKVCDFYLAMDVICSTSSILNLVAISFDRFFAVTSPILYSQHRHNPTPAYAVILLCWSISLAIGLPIMFGLNHWPEEDAVKVNSSHQNISSSSSEPQEPRICAFYNPDFIIWSSLGSFYIPCFVMVTLYYRIFKVMFHCITFKQLLV